MFVRSVNIALTACHLLTTVASMTGMSKMAWSAFSLLLSELPMPSQPSATASTVSRRQPRVMHAILAGLCASLVGIGLARFAYTPLIPSLIEAHWFAATDVMYLGAANLVGYLAGALSGRPMARRLDAPWTLRLMMAFASLAFFACAFPVSVV